MKKGVFFVFAAIVCGCRVDRDIQVRLVDAQLVKIDTIQRYSYSEKQLTWQSADNIRYVSFEPIDQKFVVGSRVMVMVKR